MRVLFLGTTLSILFFWTAQAAFAAPELAAGKTEVDFGSVVQGTKVEHTFVFRNAGDAELVISQVRSSCGCTAALLSADRLPPGGRGELRAVFDSGRFRGPVSKTVFLHSNDPRRPVVELHLRGTVRPEIEMKPEQVDLGAVGPGGAREAQVTLVNRGKRAIVLSAARATTPEIQAKLAPGPLSPGESRTLTVRVAAGAEARRVSGYVLVNAEGGADPQLRLPVFAFPGEGR